ncbi:MAG: hypothetical protein N3E37_00155 [Candidatus Micrarchaeota archaeon]|nr:hypothetical protein [Candidatus Micrarchaeota archaeon]
MSFWLFKSRKKSEVRKQDNQKDDNVHEQVNFKSFVKLLFDISSQELPKRFEEKTKLNQQVIEIYTKLRANFAGLSIYEFEKKLALEIYNQLLIKLEKRDLLKAIKLNQLRIVSYDTIFTQTEDLQQLEYQNLYRISLLMAKRIRFYMLSTEFSGSSKDSIVRLASKGLIDDIFKQFRSVNDLLDDLSFFHQSNSSYLLFLKSVDLITRSLKTPIFQNTVLANLISQDIREVTSFEELKQLLVLRNVDQRILKFVDILKSYFDLYVEIVGNKFMLDSVSLFSDPYLVINYPKGGIFKPAAVGMFYLEYDFDSFNDSNQKDYVTRLILSLPKSLIYCENLLIGVLNGVQILDEKLKGLIEIDSKQGIVFDYYLNKELERLFKIFCQKLDTKVRELSEKRNDQSFVDNIKENFDKLKSEFFQDYYHLNNLILSLVSRNLPLRSVNSIVNSVLSLFVERDLDHLLNSLNSDLDSTTTTELLKRMTLRSMSANQILGYIYELDEQGFSIYKPLSTGSNRIFDIFRAKIPISEIATRFNLDEGTVSALEKDTKSLILENDVIRLSSSGGYAYTDGTYVYLTPYTMLFPSKELNYLLAMNLVYHEFAHISFGTYKSRVRDLTEKDIMYSTKFDIQDSTGYSIDLHIEAASEFLLACVKRVEEILKEENKSQISYVDYLKLLRREALDELLRRYSDLKQKVALPSDIDPDNPEHMQKLYTILSDENPNSEKATLINVVVLLDISFSSVLFNITEDSRIDRLLLERDIDIQKLGLSTSMSQFSKSMYELITNLLISFTHFYFQTSPYDNQVYVSSLVDLDQQVLLNAILGYLKIDSELYRSQFSLKIVSDSLDEQTAERFVERIFDSLDEVKSYIHAQQNIGDSFTSIVSVIKLVSLLAALKRYKLALVLASGSGCANDQESESQEQDEKSSNQDQKDKEQEEKNKQNANSKNQEKSTSSEKISEGDVTSKVSVMVDSQLVEVYRDYFSQYMYGQLLVESTPSKLRGNLDVRKAAENFVQGTQRVPMFKRKKVIVDEYQGKSLFQKPLVMYLAIDTSGSMGQMDRQISSDSELTPVEFSLYHVSAMVLGYLEALKQNAGHKFYRDLTLKILSVSDNKFQESVVTPSTFSYEKLGSQYFLELPFVVIGQGTDLRAMVSSCRKVIEETNDKINQDYIRNISSMKSHNSHHAIKPDYIFCFFTDFGNTGGDIMYVLHELDALHQHAVQNRIATSSSISTGSRLGVIFVAPIVSSTLLSSEDMDEIGKKVPVPKLTKDGLKEFLSVLQEIQSFMMEESSDKTTNIK